MNVANCSYLGEFEDEWEHAKKNPMKKLKEWFTFMGDDGKRFDEDLITFRYHYKRFKYFNGVLCIKYAHDILQTCKSAPLVQKDKYGKRDFEIRVGRTLQIDEMFTYSEIYKSKSLDFLHNTFDFAFEKFIDICVKLSPQLYMSESNIKKIMEESIEGMLFVGVARQLCARYGLIYAVTTVLKERGESIPSSLFDAPTESWEEVYEYLRDPLKVNMKKVGEFVSSQLSYLQKGVSSIASKITRDTKQVAKSIYDSIKQQRMQKAFEEEQFITRMNEEDMKRKLTRKQQQQQILTSLHLLDKKISGNYLRQEDRINDIEKRMQLLDDLDLEHKKIYNRDKKEYKSSRPSVAPDYIQIENEDKSFFSTSIPQKPEEFLLSSESSESSEPSESSETSECKSPSDFNNNPECESKLSKRIKATNISTNKCKAINKILSIIPGYKPITKEMTFKQVLDHLKEYRIVMHPDKHSEEVKDDFEGLFKLYSAIKDIRTPEDIDQFINECSF
jgi:hypothetical protein